jgi:hypothetical protein
MAKPKVKPDMMAMHQLRMKHDGVKLTVAGLLIILNAMYMFLDWATFIGALLVLIGLVKVAGSAAYPNK